MINLQWGSGLQNGRIDTHYLIDVSGNGDYLEPSAANQWLAMRDACHQATGVWINPAPGSSCYRSYAMQEGFYDDYLYHNGNVAAVPGTSNHGWGRAIDLTGYESSDAVWDWLLSNAGQFGYDWATGRASGERWHWESLTTPGSQITHTLAAPTRAVDEETEMYYRATSKSDDGAIGDGWTYKQVGDGPVVAVTNLESVAVQASGVFVAEYNGNDIRLLSAIHGLAEYEVLPSPNKIWNGQELYGPGRFTGKIIYSKLGDREYPTVQLPK